MIGLVYEGGTLKKSKTVKIQIDEKTEKGFTVSELTVAQIIDLGQKNPLFGATLNDSTKKDKNDEKTASTEQERGLLGDLMDLTSSVGMVMDISCDFKVQDLKVLAPSDIDSIFDAFKEVNATFLSYLERMGILKASKDILEKAMSDFLRTLAI